ncbi:MAG: hydroxyisourate hydrolase [Cellvibrio sp.]|nr:hydroxyisourate hydrolase [Cellvibrio sp.]
MKRAPITTHILQLETGKPAGGVVVSLYSATGHIALASATTDADGRIMLWDNDFALTVGQYRLQFAVGSWYAQQKLPSFYPEINISFQVSNEQEHYHVPLLLNAYGYSTYRGS